jgi:hypothetical protein
MPTLGEVVAYGDLGIYRTLAQLPPEELAVGGLHPGLSALLSDASAASLLMTLECFLDLAGDVKATSAELNIHRTTLYYRLGKVEHLAGVDLGRGSDRLVLHLGLKLARLARLYPASPPSAEEAHPSPVSVTSQVGGQRRYATFDEPSQPKPGRLSEEGE